MRTADSPRTRAAVRFRCRAHPLVWLTRLADGPWDHVLSLGHAGRVSCIALARMVGTCFRRRGRRFHRWDTATGTGRRPLGRHGHSKCWLSPMPSAEAGSDATVRVHDTAFLRPRRAAGPH